MERTIIHLNVADFAVAVEQRMAPKLKKRPVIIAPYHAGRAMVFDMSEEAYQSGVRKGMSLRRARRRCKDATILAPRKERYQQAMADLLKRAMPYSPLVEPGEADGHLFVDVTGTSRLLGLAVDVAFKMRRQIKAELDLDPIWSVAPNKLVAKVATRLVKPTGEYIVGAGEEKALFDPLPIWLIPGIERVDRLRLKDFNITHVFETTALTLEQLEVPLGKRAAHLCNLFKGVDPTPVQHLGQRPKTICVEHTFADDTNDPAQLEAALYTLVEQAGTQMRRKQKAARRIRVQITYSDGPCHGRTGLLKPASANDFNLFNTTRDTLYRTWRRRNRIRCLSLTCDRLVFPPAQLPLFGYERREMMRREHLISTVDTIRQRFGPQAIAFGRNLTTTKGAP